MKKRKLNSTNPKYNPIPEEDKVKVRKEVMAVIDKGEEKNRQKIITAYSVYIMRNGLSIISKYISVLLIIPRVPSMSFKP